MKTYQEIKKLETGAIKTYNSVIGQCKIRRAKKGAIATNTNGSWFVKQKDFSIAFGNLNGLGLQSIDNAVVSPNEA